MIEIYVMRPELKHENELIEFGLRSMTWFWKIVWLWIMSDMTQVACSPNHACRGQFDLSCIHRSANEWFIWVQVQGQWKRPQVTKSLVFSF